MSILRLPSSVYHVRRECETEGFVFFVRSDLDDDPKLPSSDVTGATCHSTKDTRMGSLSNDPRRNATCGHMVRTLPGYARLQPQRTQPRMFIRPAPLRPTKFSLGFSDGEVVDAGVASAHVA